MARQLGTTKGSFYWHFKDVPAFHTALIQAWRSRALADLSDAVAATTTPHKRLRRFGHAVLGDSTETALRIWAHSNHDVRKMLGEVDAERLTYLGLLLREMGIGNADFARALLATLIGLPQLSSTVKSRTTTFDTMLETVLAL